jgi:hypothetical protein
MRQPNHPHRSPAIRKVVQIDGRVAAAADAMSRRSGTGANFARHPAHMAYFATLEVQFSRLKTPVQWCRVIILADIALSMHQAAVLRVASKIDSMSCTVSV